jgi:EmrB/QacA subfamily drug resistance transporter
MFVTMISSTIVSNALPTIIGALDGSQLQYTWIVTATLLTSTVTTPIWGKFADLTSKKTLLQIAIVIFVAGSALAGLSTNAGQLIGFRALQGIGLGGVQALAQIVLAAMIPPRERGRYNGYLGAVMALATVGGPLLGGAIVDSPLGWRWVFYVGVPFAVVALVLLQRTLDLPVVTRRAEIDYWGAALVTGGVSILLIWVTFAGSSFAWVSWPSAAMVVAGAALLVGALRVEARVAEPIIPLDLVRQRTPALAIISSLAVGIAMFGGAVFLGQYFQIGRGYSPTKAGLLTFPMMLGVFGASTVAGRLATKTGKVKPYILFGTVVLTAGFGMLATIDHETSLVYLGVGMFLIGVGVGMTMQNLVLVVQNSVHLNEIGAASGTVTFFRSLGGTIGVSVLGAILANQVAGKIVSGLRRLGVDPTAGGGDAGNLDIAALPGPVKEVVRAAYGDATGHIFLVSAAIAVVGIIAAALLKPVTRRDSLELVEPAEADEPVTAEADEPVPAAKGAQLSGS